MEDLEAQGLPEAQCMFQNSYFMTDKCIELFAEALGFSASDAIAAAGPLRTVHSTCRALTTKVCIIYRAVVCTVRAIIISMPVALAIITHSAPPLVIGYQASLLRVTAGRTLGMSTQYCCHQTCPLKSPLIGPGGLPLLPHCGIMTRTSRIQRQLVCEFYAVGCYKSVTYLTKA